jgi:hypothetical protein
MGNLQAVPMCASVRPGLRSAVTAR